MFAVAYICENGVGGLEKQFWDCHNTDTQGWKHTLADQGQEKKKKNGNSLKPYKSQQGTGEAWHLWTSQYSNH